MNIIVTSDWHLQNSGPFARPLASGLTTRAEIGFKFIAWLRKQCRIYNVPLLLHCGDFFTQKNVIPVPLYNKAFDKILRLTNDTFLIGIPGNHDKYLNAPGVHNLYVLNRSIENMWVMDKMSFVYGGSDLDKDQPRVSIYGYAPGAEFEAPIAKYKAERTLMIIHENIRGAEYASGSEASEGLKISQVLKRMELLDADICFCGDIHRPQILKRKRFTTTFDGDVRSKIIIVGAPYQMDFGDRQQKRGIWLYDTETNRAKFIEYKKGPTFRAIKGEAFKRFKRNWKGKIKEGEFLRFTLSHSDDVDWIKEHLKGQSGFKVQFESVEKVREFSGVQSSPKDLVKKYVKSFPKPTLVADRGHLTREGIRYIKLVLEEG